MKKLRLMVTALIAAATMGFALPERAEAVTYIYTGGCGWEASGSYAAAYCPHRRDWGPGPQYFRIRMQCKQSGAQNFTVVYGPWRYGGNWIASSRSCSAPYSQRVVGQTWIEYMG